MPDENIDLNIIGNIPDSLKGQPFLKERPEAGVFRKDLLSDTFLRDLTMNALYYDISNEQIIDNIGGVHDLRYGIINSTCDPNAEFTRRPENALRVMRFLSRYDNMKLSDRVAEDLDKNLLSYIKAETPDVLNNEIRKMGYTGHSKRNWDIMNKYNAWQLIFPPVKDLIGTPAFDAYIAKALSDSDAGYKKPSPMYKHYFLMAVLWPAVERDLKSRPFDKALNKVLE